MPEQSPSPSSQPTRYRVRRAVNFRAFLVTGAVVGVLLGLSFDLLGPAQERFTSISASAYLATIGGFAGMLVAAIIGLVLDRKR